MKKLMIGLFVLSLSLVGANAYGEGNDAYTVLLLHNNGADGSYDFVDDSAVGHHTVTPLGNSQIDTAEYKFGGASGLFNGLSDSLSIPDSDDWNFGAGDFTIDFWVKFNSLTSGQTFISQQVGGDYWLVSKIGSNFLNMIFTHTGSAGNKGHYTSTTTPILDTTNWFHIAFVRNGANAYIFVNGVSQALTENVAFGTMADIADELYIGSEVDGGAAWINGYMDEVRISKGIARWTSDFTPPTEEYPPSIPNTLPVAEAGDDRVADGNATVTLDGSASYDSDGSIVAYTWKRLPENTTLYSGPNPTYDTKALGRAEEVIELEVRDSFNGRATDTMVIRNSRVNLSPPLIASISDKSIAVNQNLEFSVTATDPENFKLTYSADNLPEGAIFEAANAGGYFFSWTPTLSQGGKTYVVNFSVNDGYFTDSRNVRIVVIKPKSKPPQEMAPAE